MKYLKILAVAIITMFAVDSAHAQVVVKARIGAPARRTVVVNRPVYRRTVVRPVYRPYRRTVVYHRPYRRTVVYHRPYRRSVVVRRRY